MEKMMENNVQAQETTPVEMMKRMEDYIKILDYILEMEDCSGMVGFPVDEDSKDLVGLSDEQLNSTLEWMEKDGLIETGEDRSVVFTLCDWTLTAKGKEYYRVKRYSDNLRIIYVNDGTVKIGDKIILEDFKAMRKDLCVANLYYCDKEGYDITCSIVVDNSTYLDYPEIEWTTHGDNFTYICDVFKDDYDAELDAVLREIMGNKQKEWNKEVKRNQLECLMEKSKKTTEDTSVLTDDTTGLKYKLGVNNGNIYLEEL